jgi:hypothetical protein
VKAPTLGSVKAPKLGLKAPVLGGKDSGKGGSRTLAENYHSSGGGRSSTKRKRSIAQRFESKARERHKETTGVSKGQRARTEAQAKTDREKHGEK